VLTMAPADWAGEWLRPLPPNFKMVGPLLAEPGKPLPALTEVSVEMADPPDPSIS
jgi:glucuronosyltransferase